MSRPSRIDRLAEEYATYGRKKSRRKLSYAAKLIIVLSLTAAILCCSVTVMSLYFAGVFDEKPNIGTGDEVEEPQLYEGFIDYKFDQNKMPSGSYIKLTLSDGDNSYTVQAYLFSVYAPNTVANFKQYVNRGFYNGKAFGETVLKYDEEGNPNYGRVICGGYKRNANGELTHELAENASPIAGEFLENGYEKNKLSNTAGVIGMVHGVDNNDATTDFYILPYDDLELNGRYAAFAKITDSTGLNVIRKLVRRVHEENKIITITEITLYEKK